jgi:hypothetical protein
MSGNATGINFGDQQDWKQRMRFWAVGRLHGSYPETGFEEIGARAALRITAFPRTGLLARNNFRVARHPPRIRHQPVRVASAMAW